MNQSTKKYATLEQFKQNPDSVFDMLTEEQCPIVLTVDGQEKVVVQDAESYKAVQQAIEFHEAAVALRSSMEDVRHGRTRPVQDVIDSMMREHGIHD